MARLPDPFRPGDALSDWLGCTLEVTCRCGWSATRSIRAILEQRGDQTFATLIPGLRCGGCAARLGPVYLVAGLHRSCVGGPAPDWAVEIAASNRQP